MVVIKKMSVETPRALIRAVGGVKSAKRVVSDLESKTQGFVDAVDVAVGKFEAAYGDFGRVSGEVDSEKRRIEDRHLEIKKAKDRRAALEEPWRQYRYQIDHGWEWKNPVPEDPSKVVIPSDPDPIPDKLMKRYNELVDGLIVLAIAVDDANNALHSHLVELSNARGRLSGIVSSISEARVRYENEKEEEERTTDEAAEEAWRIHDAEIAEAEADKADAEKRLRRLGAS